MARPLRVLIVEDSPDDAELMLIELRQIDPSWQRVESAAALRDALPPRAMGGHPLGLHATGLRWGAALALLSQTAKDPPFLVVSGTIGEEQAVQLVKAGADDYLLKGNLARLASAVDRTLREAAERRARRLQTEIERDRLLGQFRLQIERLPLAYILVRAQGLPRAGLESRCGEGYSATPSKKWWARWPSNVIVPVPVRVTNCKTFSRASGPGTWTPAVWART